MKKIFSLIAIVALSAVITVQAQDRKPDWARWHYLSEEEMNTPVRSVNFTETPPPTGTPRFVGEFEPMQGVMIRYPLGIPTSLVVQLANNCHVYCIVSSSYQGSAQNSFQNAGVNMNNVTFVNAPSDSYWVRDYGPWYIFEDRQPAIVDNIYNRPRPNDDNMSQVFSNFWNIPMYGMNLQHTGGNMMEDGRGHGVSDELVFQENNNNEANVRQKMRDYLGIDPYHVTIDPQGDYIAHVDCWGKYLAPDKILIAQLPQSSSQYALYEQVANYFANTNCCWGYPYRVYRVPEPGGYTLAPYTNSLILNKSVYVPMGDNASYNQGAINVYQEAMPGYNIVPVYNNDYSISWENTDALHCRTRGVMDFNMLFVDHRDVLHDVQDWQPQYPVVSKFIAYSGMDLKQDSLLVYYTINHGEYQATQMTATSNPDEYVGYISGYQAGDTISYYVFGADESGHRYTQPVFAELDPHEFIVGSFVPTGEVEITPDTIWFTQMGTQTFNIINGTESDVTIETINPEAGSALNIWEPVLPYDLHPGESVTVEVTLQTAPTKDEYLAYDIEINTTAGLKTVVAMVLNTSLDMGLYIPGSPSIELTYGQPQANPYVVNGNYGTQEPIEITAVTEAENQTGVNYLVIEHSELPYTLQAGEYFELHISPNIIVNKGELFTIVSIESSYGTIEFGVTIEEGLLTNVTEISMETQLYPNPTTGQFTVEGTNVDKVEIYNLVGQKVYEAQGKTMTINATNWNKGIYLVNITSQNGAVETRKLVIK